MVGGGILSKVIRQLARKSAHSAGYKGSFIVTRDMKAAEKYLQEKLTGDFPSYHAKKLHDLATDSGLSHSWLKELILKSKSKEELNTILAYLSDSTKTANLPPGSRKSMMKATMAKIQALHEKELFQRFMELMKQHGDDLF